MYACVRLTIILYVHACASLLLHVYISMFMYINFMLLLNFICVAIYTCIHNSRYMYMPKFCYDVSGVLLVKHVTFNGPSHLCEHQMYNCPHTNLAFTRS